MTFDLESLRGHCECGRSHELQVKDIIIEHDALKSLGGMLNDGLLSEYGNPIIICDANTLNAARSQMEDVLSSIPVIELDPNNLHANNEGVERVNKEISKLKSKPDLILAVGSGTVHDLSRFTAHDLEIDFVSCPTAASVDGFVSTVAAMTWDGMKKTMPAVAPVYVIADTTVISNAPYRLTASGMADLFGKYTAIVDWKIAHAVTGEYICDRICRMEMDAIRDVKDCMDSLKTGEEEPYAKLMYALLLSGLAMQMVGNSRPASCAEHHCSHFWEMKVLNPDLDAYHGEKVGVGLLLVTKKYKEIAEHLRRGEYSIIPWQGIELDRIKASYGKVDLMEGILKENTPDPMAGITPEILGEHVDDIVSIIDEYLPSSEDIESLLRRGGCPVTVRDIGLDDSIIKPTLELSPYVRNRLSFNRLSKMIETN